MSDSIPPRSALYIYDSSADSRQREIDRARRDKMLQERPRKPHPNNPLCRCQTCLQWARDIVNAPAPARDAS